MKPKKPKKRLTNSRETKRKIREKTERKTQKELEGERENLSYKIDHMELYKELMEIN